MTDERPELFTIGRLAERAGVPVRTIRFWSDTGLLPVRERTGGGYRLYGAEALARVELIRTLRELGLGLEEAGRVLGSEATLAETAAAHVAALDARIHALKVNRAVLSTVAKRGSTAEETALMNELARLSVDERVRIVEDFMTEMAAGIDGAPDMRAKLRRSPVTLPENPTAEQVDAWLQLAELIQDAGFRARMRRLLELTVPGRPGGAIWWTRHVADAVAGAREDGIGPESPEASALLAELFGEADRAELLECLEAGLDADAERFRRLLAEVRGRARGRSDRDDLTWLGQALRAGLERPGLERAGS
jgi:DNA-binding transcriptional MerR regulator